MREGLEGVISRDGRRGREGGTGTEWVRKGEWEGRREGRRRRSKVGRHLIAILVSALRRARAVGCGCRCERVQVAAVGAWAHVRPRLRCLLTGA